MNQYETDQRLCDLLETATARELPEGTSLDDQTAAFREGWLVLGELLESQSNIVATERILAAVRPTQHRHARFQIAIAGGILALSLCGAFVLLRPDPAVPQPKPAGYGSPAVAVKTPSRPVVAQKEPLSVTEIEWDDSLDSQIARVRTMILETRQSRACCPPTYAYFQERLHQMEQRLGEESL